MLITKVEQCKDTTKNLVNQLNFAFGGSNKVYTSPKEATNNQKITLNQLINLIKSDAPNNALKVREIVKNGFENNLTPKEIKQQIKRYKNDLPFVLFSGFCQKHHNDKNLIYNGCIQVDTDFRFTGGYLKALMLKEKVQDVPFVVLAAISPSGYGLKMLVSTDNYDINLHSDVSKALIFDLSKRLGIDSIYFDNLGASQPCFIPFDKDVYFNQNFTQYNAFKALYEHQKHITKEREKIFLKASKTVNYSNNSNDTKTPDIEILKYLTSELTKYNIDITSGYDNWYKIACSYASCGENARGLFHSVAALNSEYNFNENDKKFNEALKANYQNIGALVNICKSYNITINDFCKNWIKEHSNNSQVYRVFSDANDYKNEAITHHYNLDKNQFISDILTAQSFGIGLHLIKGGTGTGKTNFVANNLKKCIVVSRNVTTLQNYNKYGFTQFLYSDNKDGFSELQANGIDKITVTYKSFNKLRKTVNLIGYIIVFDEAHLLNESYKDVGIETKYCYNSINDLCSTNCVILMSANDVFFNARNVQYKSKHFFKKPSVNRSVSVYYNAKSNKLIDTIKHRLNDKKQVLLFTNRTENKYISEVIKTAFPNYSKYFFDGSKHGKIDLENLKHDITIVTSALVTGKDVLNENLSCIFYGLDRLISASTIVQFLGRVRNYKNASFDILFEFKNDNQNYGSYSLSGLITGCYGIATATIEASVNDWSLLRENKERFVTKQDGKLVTDWFNIDNHIQKQVSKHTILNTDVLSKFLGSHGYNATIEVLDDIQEQEQEQEQIEVVSISELYDLELNEIDANNENGTEFLTNVYNRFDALLKLGFDRETSLDICNGFKSKMKFRRFIDLLIAERSLLTNDIVFIELYNDVLTALNDFNSVIDIINILKSLKLTKKGKKTDLGRTIEVSKRIETNDKKNARLLLKKLRSYYDVEQKQVKKERLYKFVKSEYLQGLDVTLDNVKLLFEFTDLGNQK